MELFVIFGGRSPEHAVSVQSALNILQHADRDRYRVFAGYIDRTGRWSVLACPGQGQLTPDGLAALPRMTTGEAVGRHFAAGDEKVIFPIIHGPGGEDGTLQGWCESLQLPYVGCGVTASAIGMDKAVMKRLLASLDIPVARYTVVRQADYTANPAQVCQQIERQLSYPCFVKPARGGSSIGITRVADAQLLAAALQTAFAVDNKVLVEQEIVGREIEIGLLGDEQAACSLPGEFVREPSFFDYRCKYLDKNLTMRIPAELSVASYRRMCAYAGSAWRAFGCHGLARADFFLTETDEIYFNEINTLPGFTGFSMYPSLWAKAGLPLPQLIDRLVDLALQKHRTAQRLQSAGMTAGD